VATFRPIASEYVEKHDMHAERFFIPAEAWARISAARREGRRVVCVGSTAARAVETRAAQEEEGRSPEGWTETRLLIAPGYGWRATDVLMTNFHLPCTTLLAMVASLFPGGIERAKAIYAEAIRARYRFYSFGDAMLILP
jgi:S-adenosylmethionine:tRNA ribosyltransferase-isomerase